MKDGMAEFFEGFDARHPIEEEPEQEVGLGPSLFQDDESSPGDPGDSDESRQDEAEGSGKKEGEGAEGDADPDSDRDSGEDLKAEVARLEKRMKDNQASYTREHQKVLELERQLTALRSKRKASEADDDDGDGYGWFADEEEGDDEGEGADDNGKPDPIQERLDRIEQKLEEAKQQEALAAWKQKEDAFRAEHPEYDDLVDQFVVPEFERNPEAKKKWQADGASPEKAYELGRKLKLAREILDDPEAYEERLKQRIMGKGEPRRPARVSGNSAPPPPADKGTGGSVLDEVFG